MGRNGDDGRDHPKHPQADDDGDKDAVFDLMAQAHVDEGVCCDREHEQSTHGVPDLQPDALQEARRIGRGHRVGRDPSQTDDKAETLDAVGQNEVEHEHDILIVADVALVVFFPEDEAVGEKQQQGKGAKERQGGQGTNHDQALGLQVGQWAHDGLALGFRRRRPTLQGRAGRMRVGIEQ